MVEELESFTLFQGFTALQLAEISSFCTVLRLEDGEILIHESEGDDSDLYLLCSGSVEVVSNNTKMTSDEVVISKEENELFGEMAWLSGKKRTASIRCHGSVKAIRIDGDALFKYLQASPELGFVFMHRLALLVTQRLGDSSSLLKQILWNNLL